MALVLGHKLQPELSSEVSVRSIFSWFNNRVLPYIVQSSAAGTSLDTCFASPGSMARFSGVIQMAGDHVISTSISTDVSVKVLELLVATICDCILCDHQLDLCSVFEESVLLWSTAAKTSPSAKVMMPSISKLCFTFIAGKESKEKDYLRLSLVMLQVIFSFEYTSASSFAAVARNLQLILGFPYSRKSDEKVVYKMVLTSVLNSMTTEDFDELDTSSPIFFYISVLQYTPVLSKVIEWLSETLLLTLQSSPMITGCNPERIAVLMSHLLKSEKKPPVGLIKVIQASIQRTIAIEVDKENFTVSTQLKPTARKASKKDSHLHTDDIQRRVVAILQDSIANFD